MTFSRVVHASFAIMRLAVLGLLIAFVSQYAHAQRDPDGRFALGLIGGIAEGPGSFGTVGVDAAARVGRNLALGVEAGVVFSRGGSCSAFSPQTWHCSGGTSLLLHGTVAPSGGTVAPYVAALGGVYVRRGAGGFRVGSPAFGGDAGLEIHPGAESKASTA
jgi:hypothetical protein